MRFVPAAVLAMAVTLPAAAGVPLVSISTPQEGEIVYGDIVIAAEVASDEALLGVEVLLDGRRVGRLQRPPWTVHADAGYENVEHRIRVIARSVSGAVGEATVVTGTVKVDEEVSYELQQLYVTATGDGGRILDLSKGDFVVRDDGRKEQVVTFERGEVPFTAVLLVDASASMAGEKLEAALAGAQAFAAGMQHLDEAKLVAFSDRLLASTPFLGAGEALTEGTSALQARGGTALDDHLYIALKELEGRQGRRVVVVLSDGMDTHSVLTMDDVLPVAERSRALIYWVRLGRGGDGTGNGDPGQQYSAWHDGKGHQRQVDELERAVVRSGGRIVPVAGPASIAPAFEEVLRELREQYVLGYYPSADRDDGAWHEVEVRVGRRGVDVRTARGYFDF